MCGFVMGLRVGGVQMVLDGLARRQHLRRIVKFDDVCGTVRFFHLWGR